ncbi:hypothetical protein Misp01_03830 [Microtetraspora sp. NBRC 13810]|uniref:protein kinase domain-containing protein n=1 Tax=Microtetraspora sp. NBRC 13810 TaxID=3030990 RepID=UPI00249FB751|nr:hypothetical protein [Microtetraspora sp. NBRC 13810]GLW05253.1 hypothetical protein Misp01_03830 [Microtetraspora sp. NBRC 13810]
MTDPRPAAGDAHLLGGRYRLLARLDRAGGGWRARDEVLHREVTVTEVRLPPPGPYQDQVVHLIRAVAALRHPAVAVTHDVVAAPDRVWLVQEMVEGRSLSQVLRMRGPLPAEQVASIGLRVLEALSAARAQGVPHTALTPDHVILGHDGRVVLTGFGLPGPAGTPSPGGFPGQAAPGQAAPGQAAPGQAAPGQAAPGQAAPGQAAPGQAAPGRARSGGDIPAEDVLGLGTLLHIAAEGQAPGRDASPVTMGGIPLGDPLEPRTPSGPLAPLLAGMLADDPAHRPDARSVRVALERLVPPGERPRRGRGRIALVAGAAAVVLAVAAAAGVVLLRPSGAPVAAPAGTASAPGGKPAPLPTYFARRPDACALLTPAQASRLELEERPLADKNECIWSSADFAGVPANLRYSLYLQVFRFAKEGGATADQVARASFADFRRQDSSPRASVNGLPFINTVTPGDLPGLGDEAYLVEGTNELEYSVGIVVRVANVIVAAQYKRGGTEDPGDFARDGAHTAAGYILDALRRR